MIENTKRFDISFTEEGFRAKYGRDPLPKHSFYSPQVYDAINKEYLWSEHIDPPKSDFSVHRISWKMKLAVTVAQMIMAVGVFATGVYVSPLSYEDIKPFLTVKWLLGIFFFIWAYELITWDPIEDYIKLKKETNDV